QSVPANRTLSTVKSSIAPSSRLEDGERRDRSLTISMNRSLPIARKRRVLQRWMEGRMTYEHILVETEDGVGIVTLNRPDKLNAMNRQLSSELHDAVKRMEADEAIGCIVITGAGERAFSAGGDIHEQRED